MSIKPQGQAPHAGAPDLDLATRHRLVGRAALAYLLDVIAISRDGRHPLDALLIGTISQANVAPVSARADLQIALATAEAPPSDDMRRPISINALATSLRLPFETVRRRVHGLQRAGYCRIEPAGVIIPTEVLITENYLSLAFQAYERLRAFHGELSNLGALTGLSPTTVEHDQGFLPLRAAARVATDYVLRAMDLAVAEFGDLVTVLLLMEIVRSNTEHLGLSPEPPQMVDGGGRLLDAHRRPAPLSRVAKRIGAPHETARRHVVPLLETGAVQRVRGGLVVPAATLAQPPTMRFMGGNAMHLRRMFAALSQLGVLAVWEAMQAPAA